MLKLGKKTMRNRYKKLNRLQGKMRKNDAIMRLSLMSPQNFIKRKEK